LDNATLQFHVLHLWYLGKPSSPIYIGDLKLEDDGDGVSLQYSTVWLSSGFPLSKDLPLVNKRHLPPDILISNVQRAAGALDDARPDRWGEKVIRFVYKPERLSLMEYLYFAGDERFGALGVSTSSSQYIPCSARPLPVMSDAQHLSEVARSIEAAEPLGVLEAKIVQGGGSPMGGPKPKALINIGGEQWVIKFFNNEPIDAPLVEHAAMTLAQKAGITVAQTQVIKLAGFHALAIKRFDRDQGKRIHCLSAGTALRASTALGQETQMSYPALARLLRRDGVKQNNTHLKDAQELFRRMVFSILMDNTDDHEKNHTLLVLQPFENSQIKLAPAYDLLPTNSGQGFQEFICGVHGKDATLVNAMSECEAFGYSAAEASVEVKRVIDVVNTWQAHFEVVGVSKSDIANLALRIDGDFLLSQRQALH
jgi:serine/threonine-protein kinase HipA